MPETQLKLTPYGNADFAYIREEGLAYVDKTQFIEVLERCGSNYPFIVRPRRFGKTLSTNMLEAYYDEAAADQFDRVLREPISEAIRRRLRASSGFCIWTFPASLRRIIRFWRRSFRKRCCRGAQLFSAVPASGTE